MQYMDNLNAQIEQAKQTLQINDEDFIGIFLYGSQNYELDYDKSDTDSILLIQSANKPKQELRTSTGKIKIYTLKYFIYRLKQGDLECYEILCTKYSILNPLYKSQFTKFSQEFLNCINYERVKYSLLIKLQEHLDCVLWMFLNPEKARYNKKRLYWAIRVCNQLQRINDGQDFKSSLVYYPSLDYDLLKIKTITNYLSIKEFNELYKYLVKYLRSLPRYSKEVLDEEEKCLSKFYTSMIKQNLNYKGGNLF